MHERVILGKVALVGAQAIARSVRIRDNVHRHGMGVGTWQEMPPS